MSPLPALLANPFAITVIAQSLPLDITSANLVVFASKQSKNKKKLIPNNGKDPIVYFMIVRYIKSDGDE